MIDELLDLAIDEVVAGHCDRIEIVLNAGGSVTVRDNGRGIPTDIHPREGMSAAELIMTRLHASVFSEQNAQHRFGRLQGVGATVVNALSEALELRIWRDGNEYFMRFRRGHPEAPLAIFGDAGTQAGKPRRGTEISFLPSERYFTTTEFDFARIEHRLRELAALNAGVTIVLADARGLQKTEIAIRHHNPL
jgi:DNA gyrase subunit B